MPGRSTAGRTTRAEVGNRLGVFDDNRRLPLHRWYPFVEGFSSELVSRALASRRAKAVFDPFGGSGTTALTAALQGIPSSFTEVNPFLAWVADVKVNGVAEFLDAGLDSKLVSGFRPLTQAKKQVTSDHPLWVINEKRDFLPRKNLAALLGTLDLLDDLEGPTRDIVKLACLTSILECSNMIRRTDLRRRTSGDRGPADFGKTLQERLHIFGEDLRALEGVRMARTTHVGSNAKGGWCVTEPLDLIVTSPPYLNGTNYCRNTKMELLAGGFIGSEAELASLRDASVMAGINNVSNRRQVADVDVPAVVMTVQEVEESNYDQRIPRMVKGYFDDMTQVIASIRSHSRKGARFLLDIGDSRFGGVHVDTPRLLVAVAEAQDWVLIEKTQLRQRRSYDGSALTQDLLVFEAV